MLSSLSGVVLTLAALAYVFRQADRTSPGAAADQPDSLEACAAGPLQCADCLSAGCAFCLQRVGTQGWCLSDRSHAQCEAVTQQPALLDGCPSPYQHLLVALIMAYLATFSVGCGPVPWACNAEIYPLAARGLASGLSGTANWLTNGVVSQTFLLLVHAARASGAFLIYAGIALVGLLWAGVYLPETKGLSLNEVQQVFWRRVHKSAPGDADRVALVPAAAEDGADR